MLKLLLVLALLAAAQQPPAAPPATDIYELSFDGQLDTLQRATSLPVSTERGYENQPFYTPDGALLLFTANRTANKPISTPSIAEPGVRARSPRHRKESIRRL